MPRPEAPRSARLFSLAALVLATVAITTFIVVLLLGDGATSTIGRVFTPLAWASTLLGLGCAVVALTERTTRVPGVLALLLLIPCAGLTAISLIAVLA